MAIKIKLNYTQYFDVNIDGYINEEDLIDLLILIFENEVSHTIGDLNFDLKVDILDLILLCEYLYN